MAGTTKSGIRVGNWFLWMDVEVAELRGGDSVPMITARRAVTGGDVLAREILTRDHVRDLRDTANRAEEILRACEGEAMLADTAEPTS